MNNFVFISNGTDDLGLILVKRLLSLNYNVVTSQYKRNLFVKYVDITEVKILFRCPPCFSVTFW